MNILRGKQIRLIAVLAASLGCLSIVLAGFQTASAITQIPDPDPIPGSFGLEATKPQAPPTKGASITTPRGGASFSESPITVNGICPTGLLVEIYNNGVMVGSAMCVKGAFSLQVSLFRGTNELTARVYDDLGQEGPVSKTVEVTYSNPDFEAFGDLITLTSNYGRRAAKPGNNLTWPLQLSGGQGPYAFSVDWGDGSQPQLISRGTSGSLSINHIYKHAGIYRVNIKVTDHNGVTAFLQVIAVSSGKVTTPPAGTDDNTCVEAGLKILWIPAALTVLLLIPAYWLGRRSQLVSLRKQMERDRDAYSKK